MSGLSEEEFRSKYYLRKPVVITGATDSWPAELFSVSRLAADYSGLRVSATQSVQIPKFGRKHGCAAIRPVRCLLGEFLAR